MELGGWAIQPDGVDGMALECLRALLPAAAPPAACEQPAL